MAEKHTDYWYFILESTIAPKPSWFNIAQEDSIETVRFSLDGSEYILKAKKENVSPEMASSLGAMTYEQCINQITNFEPENWDDLTDAT